MRWVRGARRPLQGRWICAWYPGVALEDSLDPRLRTSSPFGLRGREGAGARSEVRGPRSEVRGPRSEVRGPRSEVSEFRWGRVGPEWVFGGERVRRGLLAAPAIRIFVGDSSAPASGRGGGRVGGVRNVGRGGLVGR
jgi:hypothetical protein